MNPDNFWPGYQIDLGSPLGLRYVEDGVFRRDFECGVVLVNQPGAPRTTVNLGEFMVDLEGNAVTSVTLGAFEGEVLRAACF